MGLAAYALTTAADQLMFSSVLMKSLRALRAAEAAPGVRHCINRGLADAAHGQSC